MSKTKIEYSKGKGWRISIGVCALLFFLLPQRAFAPTQDELKAVFLFNFTQFVSWPEEVFPSEDAPFQICILGNSALSKPLDTIVSGETYNERPIVVQHLQQAVDTTNCQIVFVSKEDPHEMQQLFLSAYRKPILTVSDVPEFPEKGGVIGFALSDRRVRLRINMQAAESANLTISSKLLRLSEVIRVQQ